MFHKEFTATNQEILNKLNEESLERKEQLLETQTRRQKKDKEKMEKKRRCMRCSSIFTLQHNTDSSCGHHSKTWNSFSRNYPCCKGGISSPPCVLLGPHISIS
jgi:ribosomal protein S27AE